MSVVSLHAGLVVFLNFNTVQKTITPRNEVFIDVSLIRHNNLRTGFVRIRETVAVKCVEVVEEHYEILRFLHRTMASRATMAEVQSAGSSKNPKLKAIPDVEIDKQSGKFKYILLKVHDPAKEREFKHIVRGTSKAAYHADIFDEVAPAIEDAGLDCECVGGGRISHEMGKKKMEIFGYSQGYGQANHSITALILSKKFRDYDNITWNNDGY